jgi:hypothetical protein
MQMFNGIGDLLEDDVEKMHQIAGNFQSRASRLKSATNSALHKLKWKQFHIIMQFGNASSNRSNKVKGKWMT